MKSLAGLSIAALLLAGCTINASTPQEVTENLRHSFINEPVNHFFVKYGMPSGEFDMDDGGRVYRWTSIQPMQTPNKRRMRVYQAPGATYSITDSYQGTLEGQYCEMRIYTDNEGIIHNFVVAVDTVGKWTASRCSEVFDPNAL